MRIRKGEIWVTRSGYDVVILNVNHGDGKYPVYGWSVQYNKNKVLRYTDHGELLSSINPHLMDLVGRVDEPESTEELDW